MLTPREVSQQLGPSLCFQQGSFWGGLLSQQLCPHGPGWHRGLEPSSQPLVRGNAAGLEQPASAASLVAFGVLELFWKVSFPGNGWDGKNYPSILLERDC